MDVQSFDKGNTKEAVEVCGNIVLYRDGGEPGDQALWMGLKDQRAVLWVSNVSSLTLGGASAPVFVENTLHAQDGMTVTGQLLLNGPVADQSSTVRFDSSLVRSANAGYHCLGLPASRWGNVYLLPGSAIDVGGTIIAHDMSTAGVRIGSTTLLDNGIKAGNTLVQERPGGNGVLIGGAAEVASVDGNAVFGPVTGGTAFFVGNGRFLHSLDASGVQTGTLHNARLPANVSIAGTLQANGTAVLRAVDTNALVGNAAQPIDCGSRTLANLAEVVAGNVVATKAVKGNGAALTNLAANNVATGTLDNARLPANISVAGTLYANVALSTTGNLVAGGYVTGNGRLLRSIDAASVDTGILRSAVIPNGIADGTIVVASNSVAVSGNLVVNGTAAVKALDVTALVGNNAVPLDCGSRSLANVASLAVTELLVDMMAGDGSLLVNLDADHLKSGTVLNELLPRAISVDNVTVANVLTASNVKLRTAVVTDSSGTVRFDSTVAPSSNVGHGLGQPASRWGNVYLLPGSVVDVGGRRIAHDVSTSGIRIGSTTLLDSGLKAGNTLVQERSAGNGLLIAGAAEVASVGGNAVFGLAAGSSGAAFFVGNGCFLHGLDASNVQTGALHNARLPANISVAGTLQANGTAVLRAVDTSAFVGNVAVSIDFGSRTLANLAEVVAGNVVATKAVKGNGAALTNLAANNVTTGTLDNARLPANISVAGTLHANTALSTTGNLVAGGYLTGNGRLLRSIDAAAVDTGTLPSAVIPNGVADGTIAVAANSVAVSGNLAVGAGAFFVGNGRFLHSLDAASVQTGTLHNARLPANISVAGTLQANGTAVLRAVDTSALVGNAAQPIDCGGRTLSNLAAVVASNVTISSGVQANGAALTNLAADNIATGTLDNARLPLNISVAGTLHANAALSTTGNLVAGGYVTGNGRLLRSIDAAAVDTGTLPSAVIPNGVADGTIAVVANSVAVSGNLAVGTGAFFVGNGRFLHSLDASSVQTGTLHNARLPASVSVAGTLQANGTAVLRAVDTSALVGNVAQPLDCGGRTLSNLAAVVASNVTISGGVQGNGASLTNLGANNVTTGTLDNARLPLNISVAGTLHANTALSTTGNLVAGGYVTGNGRLLRSIDAAAVDTGTLPSAVVPNGIADGTIAVAANSVAVRGNLAVNAGAFFVGNGRFLHSLDASSVQAGTLHNARLPADVSVAGALQANGTAVLRAVDTSAFVGNAAQPIDCGGRTLANLAGVVVVGNVSMTSGVQGNGAALTNLVANNVTTGTLDNARLPANISVAGTVHADVALSTAGNLVAGGYLTGNGRLLRSIDAAAVDTGTLPSAVIPNGIADGTIAVAANSVAVSGNLVLGNGAFFVGNGRFLHSLDASSVQTGTLHNARLPASVSVAGTLQANGTAVLRAVDTSALVGNVAQPLDCGGRTLANLAAVAAGNATFTGGVQGNGAALTNLAANNIATGTLDNARLPLNISVAGTLHANAALSTTGNLVAGGYVTGNGRLLRSIDAASVDTGTLPSAVIPNGVADGTIAVAANSVAVSGNLVVRGTAAVNALDLNALVGNAAVPLDCGSRSLANVGSLEVAELLVDILAGDGSLLINLDADHLASGTVPNARLPRAISVDTVTAANTLTAGSVRLNNAVVTDSSGAVRFDSALVPVANTGHGLGQPASRWGNVYLLPGSAIVVGGTSIAHDVLGAGIRIGSTTLLDSGLKAGNTLVRERPAGNGLLVGGAAEVASVGGNAVFGLAAGGNGAAFFVGNGCLLHSLDASNVQTGTLHNARLPANVSVAGTLQANGTAVLRAVDTSALVGNAAVSIDCGGRTLANLAALAAGNASITGSVQGNGAALTSLAANNIATGTLDNARLPANISVAGTLHANLALSTTGNLVTGGFVVGNGRLLRSIDAASVDTGTLPSAVVPNGVADGTIAVAANSVAVRGNLTVNAGAFFVGNGRLLHSLDASNVQTGTLHNARLPANVSVAGTLQANGTAVLRAVDTSAFVGNAAVSIDCGGRTLANLAAVVAGNLTLTSGNSASLTNLSANNVTTGTLDNARLPANISVAGTVHANLALSTAGNLVAGGFVVGNGRLLRSIDAASIDTGTLPSAVVPNGIADGTIAVAANSVAVRGNLVVGGTAAVNALDLNALVGNTAVPLDCGSRSFANVGSLALAELAVDVVAGDGSLLTNLDADQLVTGTVLNELLPRAISVDTVTVANALTAGSVLCFTGNTSTFLASFENGANVAEQDGAIRVSVGGSTAGNAYVGFDVKNVAGWAVGVHNADSDKLQFRTRSNFAGGTTVLTATRDGNVGINTTAPSRTLDVRGQVYISNTFTINSASPTVALQHTNHASAFLQANANVLYVLRGAANASTWTQVNGQWPFTFNLANNNGTCGGDLAAVGDVVAYASDQRLKTNIRPIANALQKLGALEGVYFDWKDEALALGFTPSRTRDDVGVLAQHVQDVLPQAVFPAPFDIDPTTSTSKSGQHFLTVKYEKLVPLLVESIKQLSAENASLNARLAALEEARWRT